MTKLKLRATEKKILKLAARNYRGEVSTFQVRGVVSHDIRAVRSLREKGLMSRQGYNYLTEFSPRAGRKTVYLVTCDAITDEGREVAKTLS